MLSPAATTEDIVAHLRSIASEANRQGMQRYGIRVDHTLGIPHAIQRDIARTVKRDHFRAMQLWDTGIAEARFIAALTADPKRFTPEDARRWAGDFDSWDIVDGVSDLFAETEDWRALIEAFAADEREFVRRASFATLCWAAVHRKKEPDATFESYLPLIERYATDERNFVRKAVNWALRTIGKRSLALHGPALDVAERLARSADKTSRWIGKDAVRELTAPKTLERLAKKK